MTSVRTQICRISASTAFTSSLAGRAREPQKKGNVHDVAVAEKLLSVISIKGSRVLADKAYGAFRIREYIATHQADY